MNAIGRAAEVEKAAEAIEEQVSFKGRTLLEWEQIADLIIAPDATPIQIKQYLAEASHKLLLIENPYQTLLYLEKVVKSKESIEYNRVLHNLITDKSTKTPRTKAEVIAEKLVANLTESRATVEALLAFFKGLRHKLYKIIDILNTMNIAEGYLQKQDRGGVY